MEPRKAPGGGAAVSSDVTTSLCRVVSSAPVSRGPLAQAADSNTCSDVLITLNVFHRQLWYTQLSELPPQGPPAARLSNIAQLSLLTCRRAREFPVAKSNVIPRFSMCTEIYCRESGWPDREILWTKLSFAKLCFPVPYDSAALRWGHGRDWSALQNRK